MEMLLSSLSSITYSQSSSKLANTEEKNSSEMRHIMESSNSAAFFVGTHRNKVSEEEQLQSIVRDTDFYKNKLVQFCSPHQLVIAMDNARGGAEEV